MSAAEYSNALLGYFPLGFGARTQMNSMIWGRKYQISAFARKEGAVKGPT